VDPIFPPPTPWKQNNIHMIPKHSFKNNRFELLFDSGKAEDVDYNYTIHNDEFETENNHIINDDEYDGKEEDKE
jgi:hypothetical protein